MTWWPTAPWVTNISSVTRVKLSWRAAASKAFQWSTSIEPAKSRRQSFVSLPYLSFSHETGKCCAVSLRSTPAPDTKSLGWVSKHLRCSKLDPLAPSIRYGVRPATRLTFSKTLSTLGIWFARSVQRRARWAGASENERLVT